MKRSPFFFLLLTFALVIPASAQTSYSLSEASTISIDGESNKSDFSVAAEVFTGSITLQDDIPTTAELTVDSKQMKSGRSLIMDRLMYGSLKSDEHQFITFVMTGAEGVGEGMFKISGDLTLAGQTNSVEVEMMRGEVEGNPTFSGDYSLNMRDYGIKPPTAMFGALITKPDVILHFNLILAD